MNIVNLPIRILLPVAAAALFAAGCGTTVVEQGDLEETVQKQLSASVGQDAPKASCPDELKAEKDATTRCSMTFEDGKLGITVKVTSVDGDNIKFDIQADEQLQK